MEAAIEASLVVMDLAKTIIGKTLELFVPDVVKAAFDNVFGGKLKEKSLDEQFRIAIDCKNVLEMLGILNRAGFSESEIMHGLMKIFSKLSRSSTAQHPGEDAPHLDDAANFLNLLPGSTSTSWAAYSAPEKLKVSLKLIADHIKPTFQRNLQQMRISTRVDIPEHVQNKPSMYLFYGLPGTGKTHAMRMLAAESGLAAFTVEVASMWSTWSGKTERRFAGILRLVSMLSNAIVFIDEADRLLPDRDATGVKDARIVTSFLEWSDGLGSIQGANIVIALATNFKNRIDGAVLSRCKRVIHFEMPDEPSRLEWWGRNAKQLGDCQWRELAKHSKDLSFRSLESVRDLAEEEAARKSEQPPSQKDYMDAIEEVKSQNTGAVNNPESKGSMFGNFRSRRAKL